MPDIDYKSIVNKILIQLPASLNGFSKYSNQTNDDRTQPPSIRHPGVFRAFTNIHVRKLLTKHGILRKSHFSTQGNCISILFTVLLFLQREIINIFIMEYFENSFDRANTREYFNMSLHFTRCTFLYLNLRKYTLHKNIYFHTFMSSKS